MDKFFFFGLIVVVSVIVFGYVLEGGVVIVLFNGFVLVIVFGGILGVVMF